jgi:hypothetical protein
LVPSLDPSEDDVPALDELAPEVDPSSVLAVVESSVVLALVLDDEVDADDAPTSSPHAIAKPTTTTPSRASGLTARACHA